MKLYFRTLGAGPALIILHGLFGSSDNWLSMAKLLSDDYKVFLLDARNHGQSPHDLQHTYHTMAEDLAEFIQDQNLVNPFLIGHSMGGKTVMYFLSRFKNTVTKAMVIDISPRAYAPHHQRELSALNSIILSELQSRLEADEKMSTVIPELMVRQFLLKGLYRKDTGEFCWRFNLSVLTNEIENIGEASPENLTQSVNVLFIKGANSEYYINKEDEVLIKKIFPKSAVHTISDAGHWVQAEQPMLFKEEVVNFFI